MILDAPRAAAETWTDFEPGSVATPYSVSSGAQIILTEGANHFLRLVDDPTVTPTFTESITFNQTDPGACASIVATFRFRITPTPGKADGLGFAILDAASYPGTNPVDPHLCPYTAEEPNFTDSYGIGLDTYENDVICENSVNHVSVHWDGERHIELDLNRLGLGAGLASGQWFQADVVIDAAKGVSLVLTPEGGACVTILKEQPIPGTAGNPVAPLPCGGRVYFGARSYDNVATFDLDDVHVWFLSQPAQPPSCSPPAPPPAIYGRWSNVTAWPIVAIHEALLPTGKVFFWDRMDADPQAPGCMGPCWDGKPRLWDPATGLFDAAPVPAVDIFCSGHSYLEDGRLLVTGGHISNGDGTDTAMLFDPWLKTWLNLPPMNAGRWYPTNVSLPNGDVLVTSGSYKPDKTAIACALGSDCPSKKCDDSKTCAVACTGNADCTGGNCLVECLDPPACTDFASYCGAVVNATSQVWEAQGGAWRDLDSAILALPLYPRMHVAPNGRVVYVGEQPQTRILDPKCGGAWQDIATTLSPAVRDYESSVLLADDVAGTATVLIMGGGQPPLDSAEILTLDANPPTWASAGKMKHARRHHNATILPDGTVLVTGGTDTTAGGDPFNDLPGAVLPAELWDPSTNTWKPPLAPMRVPRLYHSTASLLPDGRVVSSGGGHPGEVDFLSAEIYEPPYLFKGNRPEILGAPAEIRHRQSFFVKTPDPSAVAHVHLVRLSAVTHAFNQEQRLVRLGFSPHISADPTQNGVIVQAPSTGGLAPVGPYLFFLVDDNGVPSIGKMITVHLDPCTPITTGCTSLPPLPDGTPCNDGSPCTMADSCQAGDCIGGPAVVCAPLGQCHAAGSCHPGSGACEDATAPDGTACDDGDACTQMDTCTKGACSGTNTVVCSPSDECHDTGVCDGATGMCSNPAKADGALCSIGTCVMGVCTAPMDAGTDGGEGGSGGATTGGGGAGDASSSSGATTAGAGGSGGGCEEGCCACRSAGESGRPDNGGALHGLAGLALMVARRRRARAR